MVALSQIQASNKLISTNLPSGLVAVFVGATNGIGETALKAFAEHARAPRVYFVGRSQEAGTRLEEECKSLCPDGQFTFMKADVSLLKNVDDVCAEIKKKEKFVNLLFMSQGTWNFHSTTSEGLNFATAVTHYSRTHFSLSLLSQLQAAPSLRRVVNVLVGGKEGPIDPANMEGENLSFIAHRGHAASRLTLTLEALARRAPDVSFVHGYPGAVKSGITREASGLAMTAIKYIFLTLGPLFYMPLRECGERHLWLATSKALPARDGKGGADGVDFGDGQAAWKGIDGVVGSGVYITGEHCDSLGSNAAIKTLVEEGMVEKVWEHTASVLKKVTGVVVPT